MTDQQIVTREPTHVSQGLAKPRRLQVKGKLRAAIDLMVFEGMPMDAAATKVGLTTYSMRCALEKAHVLAHLRARRVVLRESLCCANDLRLAVIRDAATNMPAVQAIGMLERLRDDDNAVASTTSRQAAGVVIHIHQPASLTAHERQIEAKPLITLDCGHTDGVRPDDER